LESCTLGVGHPTCGRSKIVGCEPEPLPDVRRAVPRRAGIDKPAGVILSFQIRLYKVGPPKSVLACNLFAKHLRRAALAYEP